MKAALEIVRRGIPDRRDRFNCNPAFFHTKTASGNHVGVNTDGTDLWRSFSKIHRAGEVASKLSSCPVIATALRDTRPPEDTLTNALLCVQYIHENSSHNVRRRASHRQPISRKQMRIIFELTMFFRYLTQRAKLTSPSSLN